MQMQDAGAGGGEQDEDLVWHRATCPERGREYFYTRAGETRWDPPGELLYRAAFEGDAGAVASLLGAGAAADFALAEGGATSLYVACEWGRPEVARQLLEARADPNLAQSGLNEGESAFLTGEPWDPTLSRGTPP